MNLKSNIDDQLGNMLYTYKGNFQLKKKKKIFFIKPSLSLIWLKPWIKKKKTGNLYTMYQCYHLQKEIVCKMELLLGASNIPFFY